MWQPITGNLANESTIVIILQYSLFTVKPVLYCILSNMAARHLHPNPQHRQAFRSQIHSNSLPIHSPLANLINNEPVLDCKIPAISHNSDLASWVRFQNYVFYQDSTLLFGHYKRPFPNTSRPKDRFDWVPTLTNRESSSRPQSGGDRDISFLKTK